MSTIVFILSHHSHQNASFNLAKILANDNHNVIFGGPRFGIDGHDLKLGATKQGFEYAEIKLYKRPDDRGAFNAYAHGLVTGLPFKKFVKQYKPDLIFLDIHYSIFAIPLWTIVKKIVLMSTELSTAQTADNLPLTADHFPPFRSQKENADVWKQYEFANVGRANITSFASQVASHHAHFPFEKLLDEKRCLIPFSFKLREMILWPKHFDLPSHINSEKIYLGGQIDISRAEKIPDVLKRIPRNKKLIYVALGTRTHINAIMKQQVLNMITVVLSKMRHVHAIVVGGEYSSMSENISFLQHAPQLAILKHCDLMITHAGGNSVKECIYFKVPMLCIPSDNDQFGIAARVEHFNIGLNMSESKITERSIKNKLDKLLADRSFKRNLSKQRSLFFQSTDNKNALKLVKNILVNDSDHITFQKLL